MYSTNETAKVSKARRWAKKRDWRVEQKTDRWDGITRYRLVDAYRNIVLVGASNRPYESSIDELIQYMEERPA